MVPLHESPCFPLQWVHVTVHLHLYCSFQYNGVSSHPALEYLVNLQDGCGVFSKVLRTHDQYRYHNGVHICRVGNVLQLIQPQDPHDQVQ